MTEEGEKNLVPLGGTNSVILVAYWMTLDDFPQNIASFFQKMGHSRQRAHKSSS